MAKYNLAVIGGDGIGPEVSEEALKVIRAAGVSFDAVHYDLGAAHYLKTGEVLPDSVLAELRGRMRAVLDGALKRSRSSKVLRADVKTDDLVLVLNMVDGALGGVAANAERSAVAGRALALALDGLRTP